MKLRRFAKAIPVDPQPHSRHHGVAGRCRLVSLLVGAALAFAFVPRAHATQLAYTNTVDNWTLPSSWKPSNNWTSGAAKTNAINTDVRLNICGSVTYDATLGNTVFDVSGTGTESRALFLNTNNSGTVTLTLSGGTLKLVGRSGSGNYGALLIGAGTSAAASGGTGNLVVNGGTLDVSSAASAGGEISILPRGLSTASATLTLNSGAVLADVISFATLNAPTAGASGTLNLNGGTCTVRAILNRQSFTNAAINFNGGVLTAADTSNGASGAWIRTGNGLTSAYVKAGGAKFDTAGQNGQVIAVALLNGGATDGGVTKLGAGALTLSSVSNTYNGPTVVNVGTLGVTLPLASTSASVASNATLAITTGGGTWSLSNLALTNGGLTIGLGTISGTPAVAINTAVLDVRGSNVINVTGSGFVLGSITLVNYSSKTGGGTFSAGSLPPGIGATITDTGSSIVLNVSSIAEAWDSTSNRSWNTNGVDLNWNLNGTLIPFANGQFVLFDDSGAWGTVNLDTTVQPSGVIVDTSDYFYVFTSANGSRLGGSGPLIKRGGSTLTLATANDYTGATTVEAGSLIIRDGAALGSNAGGTTVSSGATLAVANGITVSGETVTISGTGVGGQLGALRGADSGNNIWAGPVVLGATAARIGTEDYGNLTLGGPISCPVGATYNLYLRTGVGGVITINSGGNVYGTTTFLGDGSGTGKLVLGAPNALSSREFNLGPGTVDMNGNDLAVTGLSDNAGSGTLLNDGTADCTLTLLATNNYTFHGNITDGSGGRKIRVAKTGPGTQTLAGQSLFTGGTTINQGALAVVLPMSGGSLTLADGSAVSVTVANSSWSSSSLNTTNATINLNYGTLSGAPAAVFSAGTLNMSGSNVINISAVNLPVTSIQLISYTSKHGGGAFYIGTLPPNVIATVVDTGSAIVLNVTFSPLTLTWSGGASGTWNTNGTLDWNSGAAAYQEYSGGQGDSVMFDDSASVFSLSVVQDVHPFAVTVSNNANAYTLSGPGKVSGTAGLVKQGTNTLALNAVNSFTGGTALKAGTLSFVNGGLGSASNIVLSGASTLQWAPGNTQDVSSRLRVDGTSASALATFDVGANDIVFHSGLSQSSTGGAIANTVGKVGSGKLTLADAVSTLGNVTRVNAGTLELAPTATLNVDGAGTVANAALVADNSTLLFNGGTANIGDRLAVATPGNSTGVVTIASGVVNVDLGLGTSTRGLRLTGGSSNSSTSNNVATVNLDGGTLRVARIFPGNGTDNVSIFNFNGGVLMPSVTPMNSKFLYGLTHAYVKAGGAIIDSSGADLTVTQSFEHDSGVTTDGGLVKRGAGALIMSGTNTYNGLTVVTNNGALLVDGVLGTNQVVVWAGASLGGTGIISGPVTIHAGGSLAPGDAGAIGVLTATDTVTLEANSTNLVSVSMDGGIPANDVLAAGNIVYNGTLVVSNSGSVPLQVGNTFALFQVAGSSAGNFAQITPAPGSGLAWSFNPTNGVLSVVTGALPAPTITGITISGSNLILSGTNGASSGTYLLMTGTNVVQPVATWLPVLTNSFDASGNFSITLTNAVDLATPARFYLLKQ